jgi:hypothetical protein
MFDALLVIAFLNSEGSGPPPATPETPPPFYDVNGDNFVSPIDALLVAAALNAQEGESEAESNTNVQFVASDTIVGSTLLPVLVENATR